MGERKIREQMEEIDYIRFTARDARIVRTDEFGELWHKILVLSRGYEVSTFLLATAYAMRKRANKELIS